MAEKKETAVVVAGMTAVAGTLDEKVKAFQQMAACAASGMFPAGYDQVPKIVAACWFADGLGVHPTAYMEGIQPVQFGGKTIREPKWEFVNALLRSRLPGFDFTVLEEGDTACEIEFVAAGRKSQRARYTMDEAIQQGLAGPNGRNKDGYAKNARKMLWKQCFKMGADRIGSDVLAGLPAMSFEIADETDVKPTPTPAQVLEDVIKGAVAGTGAEDVPFQELPETEPETEPPTTDTKDSARMRLSALLTRYFGKLSKSVMAEKVSEIYNAMIAQQTGENPNVTIKQGEIGPVEAEQLIAYLTERIAEKEKGKAKPKEAPQPAPAPAPVEDEAPPAEEAPASPINETVAAYEALMASVARARKLFQPPRKYVVESPPDSGKFWFTDAQTFSQIGLKIPVKIQEGGQIIAPRAMLGQLNQILAAACDEKERGGR